VKIRIQFRTPPSILHEQPEGLEYEHRLELARARVAETYGPDNELDFDIWEEEER
jgi:hypothetical protein